MGRGLPGALECSVRWLQATHQPRRCVWAVRLHMARQPGRPAQSRRTAGTGGPRAWQVRWKVVRMARHSPGRRRQECRPTRWARPRFALAAVSALFVALVVPTSSAGAQRGGSAAVIDAYESARNRGDMDTVVALFADDAVVVDSAGATYRGRQLIRLLLQPGANPDWAAQVSNCTTSGDYIFWTERVGVHGTARLLSVAAIVRRGSIKALAYGGRESLPPDTSTTVATPVLPAAYGLAGVLLAILGSLGIVTVSPPRPGHTAHRGCLLVHLRRWSEERP